MTKTMDSWFFMRPGFNTFRLEPEKHKQYLFGDRDRKQRDLLVGSLEEAGYANEGHKAAVYGDYGRGKTHQCHNIMYEIERRKLGLVPVYIKCSSYSSKEPFHSLFKEMVSRHPSAELYRVANAYQRLVKEGEAQQLEEIVQSEDIAQVMSDGLAAATDKALKNSIRWLGGEPKAQLQFVGDVKPQLTDSREFGAVLRGLAHMFVTVDRKVPLYLIDEAERFQNITHTDTYFNWLASLRELTEILNVAIIFLIGAKTRNDLPTIFVQDEIMRRVGVSNYIEFLNPSKEELTDFLLELLQTFIRKGEVPEPHRHGVDQAALDSAVPDELLAITGGDQKRLRVFPFEEDAFEEFIDQVTSGDLASKPSEVLIRLQKAAQRAMRHDRRTIDARIVSDINSEGL